MKNIVCMVALGIAAASAHAAPGAQPLFSIASDAVAPSVEAPAIVEAPAAKVAIAKNAKKVTLKAEKKASEPAAPLFTVSSDAQPVVEKVPANKKASAEKPAAEKTVAKAVEKAPAQKSVATEKPAADASADVAVADNSETASAQTLFKVASYYEADEMGGTDDAVRKIDFSKPQGQQLPSEARTAALQAIQGSKAIALSTADSAGSKRKTKAPKGAYSYVVRGQRYQTLASSENFVQEGSASWYGPGFHGKKTASGEVYDMHKLTAAHKKLPLGTRLEVTHKRTGKSVVVTVNDRGPFHGNRILDLSHAAAKELGIVNAGVGDVSIRALR